MAIEQIPSSTEPSPPQGSVVTLPRSDGFIGPTQEEIRAANAGELAPTGIHRWMQILINPWTITGSTIAAAALAYENVPAIHEKVDQTKDQLLALLAPQPGSFNAEASNGSIGKNNSTIVSLEEANAIFAKEKSKGHANDTTLLFPFIVPDQSKGIPYEYEKASKGFDPQTGRNIIVDNKSRENLPNFPVNTLVVAPVDTEVFAYGPKVKTGMVQGIGMKFVINGIEYTIKIAGAKLSEMIFQDLKDLPDLREYQKGKRVFAKRGDKLLALKQDGAEVGIEYTSTPVGSSNNEENPVNIKFLTQPNEAGINKLILLSN